MTTKYFELETLTVSEGLSGQTKSARNAVNEGDFNIPIGNFISASGDADFL
jgi:hypothetical protein